jgi:hypothetical protein
MDGRVPEGSGLWSGVGVHSLVGAIGGHSGAVCAVISSSARSTAALTMNADIEPPANSAACSMRLHWSGET